MKRVSGIIILLLSVFSAKGQEVTVNSFPDTASILIGDQCHFIISASLPAGTVASIPMLADTLAGKIIILGKPERDTVISNNGIITFTDRYLITAFDSGTYVIPPFYAEIKTSDSLKRYYSDYSLLRVMRPDIALPDTTDVIFDVVPPRKAPVTFREILPWIILLVVMSLIIWALAKFLPHNPLRIFMKPSPPPEPAHIIAFRELEKLKNEQLWQKGEVKEYYSRLSDILRRYIDGRYSIMSPELTTDETVRMLQKANVLKQGELSIIKDVLSLSDMVKFARYTPQESVHETAFSDSEKFVSLTRIPDAEPENGEMKKGGSDA